MSEIKSRLCKWVVLLIIVVATSTGTVRAQASTSAYLTIMTAHSAWTIVDSKCNPLLNVVTPDVQAQSYQSLGIKGFTSTVVTDWPQATTRDCIVSLQLQPHVKPIDIMSWTDIKTLASDGWTFVSASRDYANLNNLTWAQKHSEIVGSLHDLQSHGLVGSNGLFAFPNDHIDRTSDSIVNANYDFGRSYSQTPNTVIPVPPPYLVHTHSLNGGACSDSSQPCYSLSTPNRYTPLPNLTSWMHSGSGTWSIVQGYRFVTGTGTSDTTSWDCTSPNWQDHWISGVDPTETYCWVDWLSALSTIPSGTITADPATISTMIGR